MRKIATAGDAPAQSSIKVLEIKEKIGESSARVEAELVRVPPVPGPKAEIRRDYGIEEAIKLMRRMPESDMRLLAKVIKECLESANIRIANIIKDAEQKEGRLEEQVKKLDSEIEDLESMIQLRRQSIESLVKDLDETRQVKNHLALAEGSHDLEIDHKTINSKTSENTTNGDSSNSSAAVFLDSLFTEPGVKASSTDEE